MEKNRLIEAILSKDIATLRRASGKLAGIAVLAYTVGNALMTYDVKGKPMAVPYPKQFSIEAWLDFLTKYNVLHFDGHRELQEFVRSGKPMPNHESKGIPLWAWFIGDGRWFCWDG